MKVPPHTGKLDATYAHQLTQILKEITSSTILNGILLENVALTTSAKKVSHRLGRTPKGFIVVMASADVRVYRGSTTGLDTTQFLPLIATTTATVSLWIF